VRLCAEKGSRISESRRTPTLPQLNGLVQRFDSWQRRFVPAAHLHIMQQADTLLVSRAQQLAHSSSEHIICVKASVSALAHVQHAANSHLVKTGL
jgi:hypothetical protein